MKKSSSIVFTGLLMLGVLTQEVKALPMFVKQTGMDCTGCHMQIMPRLNKYGRKFAASGMTLSKQVEDMDINPSLLIKSKFSETTNKPNKKGVIIDKTVSELSIVRMATLYIGGRISENIGGTLNLGWRKKEGSSISGKVVYANEIEDGYWGVTFYSTPSLGPFSGMEFYNTGLYKPLRLFDMRTYDNANQSSKVGTTTATGLQIYYDKDNFINDGDHFFVTVGIYTPAQDDTDKNIDMFNNLLPFARVAYEHPIGDYNVILGAFAISGGDNVSPDQATSVQREAYGIDMQIEGDIANKETTLTLTKVFKHKVDYTGMDANVVDTTSDIYMDSSSISGAVSVTPEVVLKAGYMTFDDHYKDPKDIDYAINLGLDYGFTVTNMPIKLAVEYAWITPELENVKNYESFMATFTLPF